MKTVSIIISTLHLLNICHFPLKDTNQSWQAGSNNFSLKTMSDSKLGLYKDAVNGITTG